MAFADPEEALADHVAAVAAAPVREIAEALDEDGAAAFQLGIHYGLMLTTGRRADADTAEGACRDVTAGKAVRTPREYFVAGLDVGRAVPLVLARAVMAIRNPRGRRVATMLEE